MRKEECAKNRRFVYFAACHSLGMVKIGCSTRPEIRIKSVGEWIPFPLEMVALIKGSYCLETTFHKMFAESWSHGEWFRFEQSIKDVINRINSGEKFHPTPLNIDTDKAAATSAKKRATRMVSAAESRAQKNGLKTERPTYIYDVIGGYYGGHNPPPSEADMKAINGYVAGLDAAVCK